MRTINAGELVHTVRIEYRAAVLLDAAGAPAEGTGWATLASAQMSRADRRSDRGGESIRGDQVTALVTTRWTMKYREDMDPDLVDVQTTRRLVYGARVYDIVDAEVLDRRVGIALRTIAASGVTS